MAKKNYHPVSAEVEIILCTMIPISYSGATGTLLTV